MKEAMAESLLAAIDQVALAQAVRRSSTPVPKVIWICLNNVVAQQTYTMIKEVWEDKMGGDGEASVTLFNNWSNTQACSLALKKHPQIIVATTGRL